MEWLEMYFKGIQANRNGVSLEEFEDGVQTITDNAFEPEDVKKIFLKVDSDSTGMIDWNGFLTFVLNELRMGNQIEVLPLQTVLKDTFRVFIGSNFDIISSIVLVPVFNQEARKLDMLNARYIVASRDGKFNYWSQTWILLKSVDLFSDSPYKTKNSWVLSLVPLINVYLLAISTTEDVVKFVEVTNEKVDLKIVLNRMPATVTAMDYWFDTLAPNFAVLLLGDANGNVSELTFSECTEHCLFGPPANKRTVQEISYQDLLQGGSKYVKMHVFKSVHDDWIKQIRYCSTLKSFISCSNSSSASMAVYNITLNMNRRIFSVHRGFNCFDYSSILNVIVTGSIDRTVRVWNPYVTNKSIVTFYGHNAPICCVSLIPETDQVVSAATDKCIKVWDMKEQTCIQTVLARNVPWGPYPITCGLHNPQKRQIIFCTDRCIVMERIWDIDGDDNMVFYAHRSPVRCTLYNSMYGQIVSSSVGGNIRVWDLQTGKKVYQIQKAHSIVMDGLETACEITAMAFDESKRRLYSCGHDKNMKIWSVSNGACIKIVALPDIEPMCITNIICVKQRVLLGGWGGCIIVYNENLDDDTRKIWLRKHKADILYMSFIEPNFLATGSWDGAIRLWLIESGYLHSTLYLHQCLLMRQLLASCMSVFDSGFLCGRQSCQFHPSKSRCISKPKKLNSFLHPKMSKLSAVDEVQFLHLPNRPKTLRVWNLALYNSLKENPPPVYCLLTLAKRDSFNRRPIGNLVASDFNGMVQLWSTHVHGGLLAMWPCISSYGSYVSAMATDTQNHYLLCGDTDGYLRMWFIRYYHSGVEEPSHSLREVIRFPFLRKRLKMFAAKAEETIDRFTPTDYEGVIDIHKPRLLLSFRAHVSAISSIEFIEPQRVLQTAASDGCIRLWTIYGRFIAAFGDPRGWKLSSYRPNPLKTNLPQDVRKVASATTLQVLSGGLGPRWNKVRELFVCTYVKAVMRRKLLAEGGGQTPVKAPKAVVKTDEKPPEKTAVDETQFLNMGSALGRNFAFLPHKAKRPILPSIPASKKENNAVYAYLKQHELTPFHVTTHEISYPTLSEDTSLS